MKESKARYKLQDKWLHYIIGKDVDYTIQNRINLILISTNVYDIEREKYHVGS